jgi:integrase
VRVRFRIGGRLKTLDTFESDEDAAAYQAHFAKHLVDSNPHRDISVADLGDKVLTRRELRGKISDPESDWSRFRNHIQPDPVGRMPIRSLTREHVEDWLERLEDKELGEQTIRNCRNVLSVICEYAVKKRLVKTNPARGIRRDAPKRTDDPWTYATLEEQARLIEEAAKDGLDCLIEFAMGSGLREGEQCMLYLCDMHLDDPDPHLWVRYGGLPTAKHPRGQPPKSGRIRRIQLFGLAKRALERWLPQLPKFCPDNPHGLVFPRKRGGYRDPDHIIRWEEWKGGDEHRTPKHGKLVPGKAGILKRAGISRDFRWHDLRHT